MSSYVVAKYLRISSEDMEPDGEEKRESDSISNQRALLEEYIKGRAEFAGAENVEYSDDGWSGKNFERPAVQELLKQAMLGRIQCIVVKDLSRFGRDYITVGAYISHVFPLYGVRFIAVNDGLDTRRPMDAERLDVSFRSILYDLYSRDLSEKVRCSHRQRAKRGDFTAARAPYGYVKDPDRRTRLAVDPPAAEVVRRIFALTASGMSTTQTAGELNRDGVLTPMLYKQAAGYSRKLWRSINGRNYWTNSSVLSIVRDCRYLGKSVYGKRRCDKVGGGHSVKVPKEDWIIVEGTHEAIVSQEEFERAQTALGEYRERGKINGAGAMRGKVRCGVCGRSMRLVIVREPYYVCRTREFTDEFDCPAERIPESGLWEVLRAGLQAVLDLTAGGDRMMEERREKAAEERADAERELERARGKAAGQRLEARELYEAYALNKLGRDAYLEQKKALVRQGDELQSRIAGLEKHLREQEKRRGETKTGDWQPDRGFIAEALKECLIYPGGRMEVVWGFRDEYVF